MQNKDSIDGTDIVLSTLLVLCAYGKIAWRFFWVYLCLLIVVAMIQSKDEKRN